MLTPGRLNSGEPVGYGDGLGYGLGLVIGRYRGLKTVAIPGADWGYRAEFLQFPDQQFTVIVLGNLDTLSRTSWPRGWPTSAWPTSSLRRPRAIAGRRTSQGRRPVRFFGTRAGRLGRHLLEPGTRASWTFAVHSGKLCLGHAGVDPPGGGPIRARRLCRSNSYSPRPPGERRGS